MLKRSRLLLASLVALSFVIWAPVTADADNVPAAGAETISVGNFLLRYAEAMGLPLAEGSGPAEAAAELVAQGIVNQNTDLHRPLTEGDVVKFASRSGLRLSTMNTDRVFPVTKVDSFFTAFGGIFEDPAIPGGSFEFDENPNGNNTNGKGKKTRTRTRKRDFESPTDDESDSSSDSEDEDESD